MKKEIIDIDGYFEFWGDISGLPAYPKKFIGEITLQDKTKIDDKEINNNKELFIYLAKIIPCQKIKVIY